VVMCFDYIIASVRAGVTNGTRGIIDKVALVAMQYLLLRVLMSTLQYCNAAVIVGATSHRMYSALSG